MVIDSTACGRVEEATEGWRRGTTGVRPETRWSESKVEIPNDGGAVALWPAWEDGYRPFSSLVKRKAAFDDASAVTAVEGLTLSVAMADMTPGFVVDTVGGAGAPSRGGTGATYVYCM
jgi:hypothetical protein